MTPEELDRFRACLGNLLDDQLELLYEVAVGPEPATHFVPGYRGLAVDTRDVGDWE